MENLAQHLIDRQSITAPDMMHFPVHKHYKAIRILQTQILNNMR